MSSDYACRRLYEALDCLVADGPIQDRLGGAALHLVNINSAELPEETQLDFNEVKQQLSIVLANFFSNEESTRIARKLLSLYRSMSWAPR